jgi:cysteine synthase A
MPGEAAFVNDPSLTTKPVPLASSTKSALELIGNTPLLTIGRAYRGPGRILAKAEFLQPGGSVKDRAACAIVMDALKRGDLRPGQCVVSMTSGNFGSGLAVVCNVVGHPLVAAMSAGNSAQRARMIQELGAELVLVPQVDGVPGSVTGKDIQAATAAAIQIATERNALYIDQFRHEGSVRAHQQGTGPELYSQVQGNIDGFVACVGSGGTFVGIARFLRRQRPSVVCAAVEPEGVEVLGGKAVLRTRHILQGTGYGSIPHCWDSSLMDLSISVSDEEASDWKARLARYEGLHVGYSAAANVCAATKLLESERLMRGATVVTILCDSGLKY